MLNTFWKDEEGVILSAEIVLLGTILVLGMIVGLVEVQSAVVAEMSDLGDAIGNMNQSYQTPGIVSLKHIGVCGIKAATYGASYNDLPDVCDCNAIIVCDPRHSRGEKAAFGDCGAVGGTSAHHGRVFHPGAIKPDASETRKRQPVPPVPSRK
ncbi:MAG: hypothetical protein ABGZ23_02515 [Fuerstiella sp.]